MCFTPETAVRSEEVFLTTCLEAMLRADENLACAGEQSHKALHT